MAAIGMRRLLAIVAALGLMGAAPPPATPRLQMWRINCGTLTD